MRGQGDLLTKAEIDWQILAQLAGMFFVWPAGFDPRVAPGVPAPPGSVGICIDGSAAYLKAAPADAAWIYLQDLSYYLGWLVAQSPVLQRLAGISYGSTAPADMAASLYLESVLRDVVLGRPLQMIWDCGVPADYTDGQTVVLRLPVMPSRAPETKTFVVQVVGPVSPGPGEILVDLSAVSPGDRDLTAQTFRSAFYNDWTGLHFGNAYPIDSVTHQLTMYSAACHANLNDGTWGKIGGTATGFLVVYQQGAASALETILTEVDSLYLVGLDRDAGARGLTQVSGTLGTPAASYDVAGLACETKGGLVLEMALDIATSGGVSGVRVKVNGSATINLTGAGTLSDSALGVQPHNNTIIAGYTYSDLANAGDHLNLVLEVQRPQIAVGHRTIRLCSEHFVVGTGLVFAVTSQIDVAPAAGEIDALGVEFFSAGGTFTAASSHVLTRRIAP